MEILDLQSESFSAAKRAISMLAPTLLSEEELEERREYALKRNLIAAHATDYNRSAEGQKGGETRAEQYIAEGKNAAGHNIWPFAQRLMLQMLLEDENNYHNTGAHTGKPNHQRIRTLLNEQFPILKRTTNATRLRIRRLLNGDTGE